MKNFGLEGGLLLGLDTCGATGSVALGRMADGRLEISSETRIAGGELSVSLLPSIAALLAADGVCVDDLTGIVAVAGPGSFTGIRIGLAAVKGLAEAANLPVITLSRLALLAEAGAAPTSVLDAHRGQFYCGIYGNGAEAREMLLTAGDINSMGGLVGRVAVCEETVAQLLEELYGQPELMRVEAPAAAAALRYSLSRWQAAEFADIAALDGYYLRGADAKVSGGAILR